MAGAAKPHRSLTFITLVTGRQPCLVSQWGVTMVTPATVCESRDYPHTIGHISTPSPLTPSVAPLTMAKREQDSR